MEKFVKPTMGPEPQLKDYEGFLVSWILERQKRVAEERPKNYNFHTNEGHI